MNLEFFWGGWVGGGRGWSDDGKQSILLGWPYPFYCCYARSSTIFSSDNGKHEAILFQFLNCCSLFYEKKLSFLGTINFRFERLRSNSLSEGAARSYKKREFWHQIKALLWLCLEVSFFSCVKKKTSFRILTGSTIYTRVKKIFRSSNWLELICVWKFRIKGMALTMRLRVSFSLVLRVPLLGKRIAPTKPPLKTKFFAFAFFVRAYFILVSFNFASEICLAAICSDERHERWVKTTHVQALTGILIGWRFPGINR